MTENHNVCAGLLFIGHEAAAQLRLDPQRREQVPRNDFTVDMRRTGRSGERDARGTMKRDRSSCMCRWL